jgi:hypothetical protein
MSDTRDESKWITGEEWIRKNGFAAGGMAAMPCEGPAVEFGAKRKTPAELAATSNPVPVVGQDKPKAALTATSGSGAKPKTGGPRDKEFPNPYARPNVSEADRLVQNLGPNVAKVAAGIRMPKR